jgi:hypothetical protein
LFERLPEKSQQDDRSEGRTESRPCKGYDLEDGAVRIPGNTIPTTAIPRRRKSRDVYQLLLSKSRCMNSWMMFSETDEEAARSCESEVDIVAARIPERIIPAKIAKSQLCLLMSEAIWTITFSESEPSRKGIASVAHRQSDDTDQDGYSHGDNNPDEATLLESFSLLSSSIAINLKKNVRHSEIAESPRRRRHDFDQSVRLRRPCRPHRTSASC